jgi:hypothetical protein
MSMATDLAPRLQALPRPTLQAPSLPTKKQMFDRGINLDGGTPEELKAWLASARSTWPVSRAATSTW